MTLDVNRNEGGPDFDAAAPQSDTLDEDFNDLPEIGGEKITSVSTEARTFSILPLVEDGDGDAVEIIDFEQLDPAQGVLEQIDETTFKFVPANGFSGDVDVRFEVSEQGNEIVGYDLSDQEQADLRSAGILRTVSGGVTLSVIDDQSVHYGNYASLLAPNDDGLEFIQGKNLNNSRIFTLADLTENDTVALSIKGFETPRGIHISDLSNGQYALSVDDRLIGSRDVKVTWSENGVTHESNLRIHVRPAEYASSNQNPVGDPATFSTQAFFNTSQEAYVLFRPNAVSEWTQIASHSGGITTSDAFETAANFDAGSGEYVLVYGHGKNGQSALDGKIGSLPRDAIAAHVDETRSGAKIEFHQQGGEVQTTGPVAIVYLTDHRLTDHRPVSENDIPQNEDLPTDEAYVTNRDYTAQYTLTYDQYQTVTGGLGYTYEVKEESDKTTELVVTITTDMVVDARTAAATGLTEGSSIATGLTGSELRTWVDYLVVDEERRFSPPGRRSAKNKRTTFDEFRPADGGYDGQDVNLVGFGMPQNDGDTSSGSAFFIQGDNALVSGQNGDTLGRITFEVYPTPTTVNRVTDETQGDITLVAAYSVSVTTGQVTSNLSDEFFIRPSVGLGGQFEIGLEAGTNLLEGEFADQMIVLEIEGKDAQGNAHRTKVYFDPITGTQTQESLRIAKTFESTQVRSGSLGAGSVPAADDPVRQLPAFQNIIEGIVDDAQDIVGSHWVYNSNRQTAPKPSEDALRSSAQNNIEITGRVDLDIDKSLITNFNDTFTPTVIGSFDETVDINWSYSLPRSRLVNPRAGTGSWNGSFTQTDQRVDFVGVTGPDVDLFNQHFEIVHDNGRYAIRQTEYIDPSTPPDVSLQLNLQSGETATVALKLNDTAVKFPGREIEEELVAPELEDGAGLPTGLVGEALSDQTGNFNVEIGGVTATSDVIQSVAGDVAGIYSDLLQNEETLSLLLEEAGHAEEDIQRMIQEIQDAEVLNTISALAPGLVSLEGQNVKTSAELLVDYVGADRLDAYQTQKADEIVAEYFPGLTASDLSAEMISQVFGLEILDGQFTGAELATAPLANNISRLTPAERELFTTNWLGLAATLDPTTSTDLLETIQNNPAVIAGAAENSLGDIIDAEAVFTDALTDRFMVYYADGDLSEEDIEAILEDEELLDALLLSSEAALTIAGVDLDDSPVDGLPLEAARQPVQFVYRVLRHADIVEKYASHAPTGVKKLVGRSILLGISNTASFVPRALADPDSAPLLGFAAAADVVTLLTDIDSHRHEVKTQYLNNRGDARTFAVNSFFSLGRVVALSALADQDDLSNLEKFSFTVDAISSFGQLSGPLWRLTEYFSRGTGAEWITENNQHYQLVENGGQVKIQAATTNPKIVRDPDIIRNIEADQDTFRRVVNVFTDPATGNVETGYFLTHGNGNFVFDMDGKPIELSADEYLALRDKAQGSEVLTDSVTGEKYAQVQQGYTRNPDAIDKYFEDRERLRRTQVIQTYNPDTGKTGTPIVYVLDKDGKRIPTANGNFETMDFDTRKSLVDNVSNTIVKEDADGFYLVRKRTADTGFGRLGDVLDDLADGRRFDFRIDADLAGDILRKGVGQQISVDGKVAAIDRTVWNKAVISAADGPNAQAILGANVGDKVTLTLPSKAGEDGPPKTVDVKVTSYMQNEVALKNISAREAAGVLEGNIGDPVKIQGIEFKINTDIVDRAIADAVSDPEVAADILNARDGNVIRHGPSYSIEVNPEIRNAALASVYRDELKAAAVGDKIDLPERQLRLSDGSFLDLDARQITVTEDLVNRVSDLSTAAGDGISHPQSGAGSNRARLLREFLGADPFSRGLGRLASLAGPFVNPADLQKLSGIQRTLARLAIGKRAATFAAGTAHILHGLSKVAGDLVDIVGVVLDAVTLGKALSAEDRDALTIGISGTQLGLSVVGLGVSFSALLGGASVSALAGPIGLGVFAASLVVSLVGFLLERNRKIPDPTNAEIFSGLIDFLQGENSFGANVLNGPQVKISNEFTEVTLVPETGELHIPESASEEDIANAIGDAYDNDQADWLIRALGLFRNLSEQQEPAMA